MKYLFLVLLAFCSLALVKADPQMEVLPGTVPVGHTVVTINGEGFKANTDITINTSMFPQPRVTTDAEGAFSIEYVPLSGWTHVGPASVQAVDKHGRILATAGYTVQ